MVDITSLPPEQQFDFWLGTWDVSWEDDQHGTNRIERILEGRVIQENFDGNPAIPFRGMSVSVYSKKLQVWRQTWVDVEGNYWSFQGGVENGNMVLATEDVLDGKPIRLRMTFYNIQADQLDWKWESSEDNGATWTQKWHIHYQRKSS